MTQRHVITLPDHDLSNSAARRCKFWMKVLTGIDRTQSNGYAFQGNFRDYGTTVELDENAWVLAYMEDRRASGRLDWHDVTLYQVQGGTLTKVETWRIDGSDRGWALHVRDAVDKHMSTPPAAGAPDAPDADELRVERTQLLTRLAEINALLGEANTTVDIANTATN